MARTKKVESISTYYSSQACGRVDKPVVQDEYEQYAEHFLGDYEEEMDVTYFVKEVAC